MALLPGTPPIEIVMKRSAQARRFSLRVSRLDGRVTLTLPARARETEAMRFLSAQEGWLRQTLAEMPEATGQPVGIGAALTVEGRVLQIESAGGRAIRVEGARLLVPGDPASAGRRIGAWLRVLARDRLARASDHYAGLVGRRYSRLTLRDTRSRWGSCSPDGALMYSWRLILAPPEVLAYVAAHEAAHLVEMNHSAAYWAVVERIYPGWQRQRAWLRAEGQALHRPRFGD
ncbi:M48 family metallopeptidase [Xinfangfangia pollutisoli]|uniref:M48 family metallopeptidase n=1 Tax=Xinfangfangia pollutisoli TaxID=2865960 RepID=UPI001CD59426|nr:SprT family zinc-dependent metalloprotease [Xinfangfangia pollutisoli]